MAIDDHTISQINSHGRNWRLAVDVRVVEDGTTYWCEITRRCPIAHTTQGYGDPGLDRLLQIPVISIVQEKSLGSFSTQPMHLVLRNDDAFFDRTKGVYLIDTSGNERFLKSLYRARVRLRMIPLDASPEDESEIVCGHYYIEGISSQGAEANLSLQPLLKLLQTVSPANVKAGERWFRDINAAELIRRLVEHALPDVEWEAGSPPDRIAITVDRDFEGYFQAGHNLPPAFDNFGRQPEKIGGELTFDTTKIPTYIVAPKDVYENTNYFFYALADQDGRGTIYRYDILTGNSTLLYTGPEHRPVAFILQYHAERLLFCLLGNQYDEYLHDFQRELFPYTMKLDGTDLQEISDYAGGVCWAFCDSWIRANWDGAANWFIGVDHPTYGTVFGEMLTIGFPQFCASLYPDWSLHIFPYSFIQLVQNASLRDHTGDQGTALVDAEWRFYDHCGWTYTAIAADNPGYWALMHYNPFPFPLQYVPGKNWFVYMSWAAGGAFEGTGDRWRLARYDLGGGSALDTVPITFPDIGSNTDKLRQYQPTAWGVASATDDHHLGSINWLIIATQRVMPNWDGASGYVSVTQLWKLDLDATPDPTDGYCEGHGLTKLVEVAPADDSDAPWPTFLDFCYYKGEAGGAGSYFPYLFGCYLDRKTGLYHIFRYDLHNDSLTLANVDDTPISGGPFVGFQTYQSSFEGGNAQRYYFRDTATGCLWQGGRSQHRILARGAPVNGRATWEATPKFCILPKSDPKDARIIGACAPTSPLWVFPQNSLGNPIPSTGGTYDFWCLAPDVTLRVPIADFREDLVTSVKQALEHIAQAAGPDWQYGFNPTTGKFYFKQIPSEDPTVTMVDALDRRAEWSELEIPIAKLARLDVIGEGESVQNQIVVIPWEAEIPAVGGEVQLVPRVSQETPQIMVEATALTDAARRIVLNVVRDGTVGTIDFDNLVQDDAWGSRALLSWSEDAEDILTELAEPISSYAAIPVKGMQPSPTGSANERMINGTIVRAKIETFPSGRVRGDWIQVGDSPWGRITSFTNPNVINTEYMQTLPPATIPANTTVRIQPARMRNAHQIGTEGGELLLDDFNASATTVKAANADAVHVGNVIYVNIDEELMLVAGKRRLPTPDPPYTHELTLVRSYLQTTAQYHNKASASVFLHPIDDLPMPIGSSGLAVRITTDAEATLEQRTLKHGDRIVLDFPGARARVSKFDRGIAEGPHSIELYGKRQWEIKQNPYISTTTAIHLAPIWLEAVQYPLVPLQGRVPLALELDPALLYYVLSSRRLIDEPDNQMTFRLRSLKHDIAKRATVVTLISTAAAKIEGTAKAGVGMAIGGGT